MWGWETVSPLWGWSTQNLPCSLSEPRTLEHRAETVLCGNLMTAECEYVRVCFSLLFASMKIQQRNSGSRSTASVLLGKKKFCILVAWIISLLSLRFLKARETNFSCNLQKWGESSLLSVFPLNTAYGWGWISVVSVFEVKFRHKQDFFFNKKGLFEGWRRKTASLR